MDLRETYNKIAKDWQQKNSGITWSTAYVQKFAEYFAVGAKILDVGCGPGTKALEMLQVRPDLQIHGIDISEEMIRLARETESKATFEVMEMENLDGLKSLYDGILAVGVLLHLHKSEVPSVVEKLWNTLNPGGYCFVSVKELRPGELEEQTVTTTDLGYEVERFFSYFTADELKGYFLSVGDEIVFEDKCVEGKTTWLNLIVRK